MQLKLTIPSAVLTGLLLAIGSSADVPLLNPGDPAPALRPGKWVQGAPIQGLETGKVYIVDFWATWCPPCVDSMPHLNALHERYKDRGVVVVGQNVSEPDDSAVLTFLKKMEGKLSFPVALDDKSKDLDGAMAKNWMVAAGHKGLPATFVVDKQGRLAWIGHPMAIKESMIEDLIADRFDIAQAAAEMELERKTRERMAELVSQLSASLRSKEWDRAGTIVDEIEKVLPEDQRDGVGVIRFQILLGRKDYPGAFRFAESLSETHSSNFLLLNELAWVIATRPGLERRDLKAAERIAERANKAAQGNVPGVLDTLARIQFMNGKKDEAVASVRKALAIVQDEQARQYLQRALTSYEQGRLPQTLQ